MITNVTVPARLCRCEALLSNGSVCGYEWISLATRNVPTHCQNRECRSREWNGVKPKHVPAPKPAVILPKPNRVRGGNDDDF